MSNEQSYSSQVAEEVRAQMARAGRGPADLAEMIGVSRPTALQRWAGRKGYSLDELHAIAVALNIPVSRLVLPSEVLSPAA